MQPDSTNPEQQPSSQTSWPIIAGSYRLGDPAASVAVCALTSDELLAPLAALPGVAIAGEVQTANLGIEHIVQNITANPFIRFLLLCGKDSRLFRQGQSLSALIENGIDEARNIIGAEGYEPVLRSVLPQQVAAFRQQVELVDWRGEHSSNCQVQKKQGYPGKTTAVKESGKNTRWAAINLHVLPRFRRKPP